MCTLLVLLAIVLSAPAQPLPWEDGPLRSVFQPLSWEAGALRSVFRSYLRNPGDLPRLITCLQEQTFWSASDLLGDVMHGLDLATVRCHLLSPP